MMRLEKIKPILRDIIELSDDRKIILFEYFATKKKMTEETFNELMIELKGDKMPSVAQIWMERGKLEEIQDNIKRGITLKFKQFGDNLFVMIKKIQEIDRLKKIHDALFVINDADEFQRFVKKTIQEKNSI